MLEMEMTDTKQTIEEQILNVESVVESYAEHGDRLNAEAYGSILASLKEWYVRTVYFYPFWRRWEDVL